MNANAPDRKSNAPPSDPALQSDGEASSEQQSPPLIGIGASAGGLKALQELFEALPADTGMSFVVIMHLDPQHESSLPELLQNKTDMPVVQVTERIAIEANHVYVIPPNKRLEATDHALSVTDFEEPRGRRVPIDHFFRSLAVAHGDGAGIILSGGGADGAVGIKAIKEAGGLVLVQDPSEAEYAAMPRSAIATGLADQILPAREMGPRLVELKKHRSHFPKDPDALAEDDATALRHILAHLQTRTGHDFSQYKRSTVLRRLQRRMQVSRQGRFQDYLTYLREHPEEAHALFKEMLIGVTTFFRDADAFEALERDVIPKLFADKDAGDAVRVWVVGCSTGEEAYSIAMLLCEHAATLVDPPKIQIFASDLDEGALATAREGVYPHSIEADVSEERLHRFFDADGHHYRVNRTLRNRIVFASHSVLRDPPFTRVDLITCRNLLIYLQREMQQQVFGIFHYALQPGGYLFLGSAEAAEASDLFRPFDKKHRLYQGRERTGEIPRLPTLTHADIDAGPFSGRDAEKPQHGHSERMLHQRALETYAPPSVLVDERYNVVHLSEHAGRYLQHPGGTPTNEITRLVRSELRMELQAALIQVFKDNEPTVARPVPVQFNGHPRIVHLTVRPAPSGHDDGERLALVIFNEDETDDAALTPAEDAPAGDSTLQQLEAELQRARKQLRTTTEEYESAQEELKAQNEELRSINEEYKSATEELETSKEELQSVNEELQTVNSELQSKLEEVSRAYSDLQNLVAAADVGTIFLDRSLCIKRFTPQITNYFNIRDSDRGRPIGDITPRFEYDGLKQDAHNVLDDLTSIEREIPCAGDRWCLVRVQPYRTVEDKIDGVVVTFVDVTALKRTEAELRAAKQYAEMIVDTVREGLLVLDEEFRVQSASSSFYDLFQLAPGQVTGHSLYEVGDGEWNIPELRELLEDVLPHDNAFNGFEVTHTFSSIGERTMLLNGRRLDGQQKILLAIEDITERRQAVRALQRLNETLEERVEARTRQVRDLAARLTMAEHQERQRIAQILHDDLQQQLFGIQMKMPTLQRLIASEDREQLPEEVEQVETWTKKAIETARHLAVDLSPPVLENEGLIEELTWLKSQMQEMYGLTVDIQAEKNFRIPDEAKRVVLFQIVRELLFNVVKHADVDRATVALHDVDGSPTIRVTDEGQGFDVSKLEQQKAKGELGFGLFAIRERLDLIGGRLEIDAAPGDGTRVTVYTPWTVPPSDPPGA